MPRSHPRSRDAPPKPRPRLAHLRRAELRIHYRTLGQPQKDAHGVVRNAVLIGHGTGGSGTQFIRPEFAGELFGAGQLLAAAWKDQLAKLLAETQP